MLRRSQGSVKLITGPATQDRYVGGEPVRLTGKRPVDPGQRSLPGTADLEVYHEFGSAERARRADAEVERAQLPAHAAQPVTRKPLFDGRRERDVRGKQGAVARDVLLRPPDLAVDRVWQEQAGKQPWHW